MLSGASSICGRNAICVLEEKQCHEYISLNRRARLSVSVQNQLWCIRGKAVDVVCVDVGCSRTKVYCRARHKVRSDIILANGC